MCVYGALIKILTVYSYIPFTKFKFDSTERIVFFHYLHVNVNYVFSNSDVRFIILDNVANDIAEPCIMDVKIGRQTWDPEATLEKRKNEDVSFHCCPVVVLW
jgi:hypothetical protein